MKKNEKRQLSFNSIELRAEIGATGKKIIEGIIPYNSKSVPMFGVTEVISRTAFNKTISDKSIVRALYNHDTNRILGSTESNTLQLENTDDGLICRCELPNTSYANDMYEIVNRGDIKTMSFGFEPIKWLDDSKTKTRTLKEVKLIEVSYCVPFPAYEETNSVAYMRGLEKNNIDIEKLNEVLEKDTLQDDDKKIIKQTVDSLRSLIIEPEAVEPEQANATLPQVDTSNILLQLEAELAL